MPAAGIYWQLSTAVRRTYILLQRVKYHKAHTWPLGLGYAPRPPLPFTVDNILLPHNLTTQHQLDVNEETNLLNKYSYCRVSQARSSATVQRQTRVETYNQDTSLTVGCRNSLSNELLLMPQLY